MNTTRLDLRNALLCATVALLALLSAWPFAPLPFNDDWTWADTVLRLSTTGHLLYDGWSSPPVIAQAYWGLLWVKVFGFSVNVLRVSTLPMSFGAVLLCYLLARRSGLTVTFSVFAALLLGLCPIFMPLACTFMTDVPGVFFMLLSAYALIRGFESHSRRAIFGWVLLCTFAALIGGSSRQIVWIVPMLLLPYFAWLRRSNPAFVISAILGLLVIIVGVTAIQRWYSLQPYALPDPSGISYFRALQHYPRQSAIGGICLILTLTMMLLPAAMGTLRLLPGLREMCAVVIAAAMFFALRRLHHSVEPWMGNIFTSTGVLGSIEVFGGRPLVFRPRGRLAISLLVIGTLALLISAAAFWLVSKRRSARQRLLGFFLKPPPSCAAASAMVLLSLALLALEMTRVISGVAYDRHLLPFIPFLTIPLLLAFQREGMTRMPIWSWLALWLYAIFAIASTQEVNSLSRARAYAIHQLQASGVRADQIDAGFEYNYWTQVQLAGHVNDSRVKNPPGVFAASQGPTPAMKFAYRLESRITPDTEPTPLGTVAYFSLLPPFHRTIRIDRFTDPWWLDPTRAATRPAPQSLLPTVLLEQYNLK